MTSLSRLFFPLLFRVVRRFGEDGLGQVSASLAFTTLLSLVPLAGLMLAIASAFPAFSTFVNQIDTMLVTHLLPASSAGLISGKILQFSRRAAEVSALGVAMLVVASFLMLHTVEHAFNTVWRVKVPRPMWHRLFLYVVLIAVWPVLIGGLLAVMSYAVTTSFGWVNELRWLRASVLKGISLAVLVLLFTFLYRTLPNAAVRWRDAFWAGVFAALGFIVLQKGFEVYLAFFPSYKAIYGAFSAVPIFLLWMYFSWAVILVGALVAALLPGLQRSPARRVRRR